MKKQINLIPFFLFLFSLTLSWAVAVKANSLDPVAEAERVRQISQLETLLGKMKLELLLLRRSLLAPLITQLVQQGAPGNPSRPNNNGTSNHNGTSVGSLPVIENISPSSGGPGTQITLRGSGFTPTNNVIYAGYGAIPANSTDGRTLTFTFNFPHFPTNLNLLRSNHFPSIPLRFYVRNANGLSSESGMVFTFRL